MKTVSFKTFGCKLNQAETASLALLFENHGYQPVSDDSDADVFVVNTCTVTGRSDAKCRQTIRQRLKKNPATTVIVLGCYSQVSAEEIREIPGVDYILGTQEKADLFQYFDKPGKLQETKIVVQPVTGLKEAVIQKGDFLDQTRAFLKIQDGCSRFCSYCIVPYSRGPNRSVSEEEIIEQAGHLIRDGYKEIVLTGVHIGEYGKAADSKTQLPSLLRRLTDLPGLGRIRLSSLNSDDITEELIDTVQATEKICRHFHVPLQSGSDTILHKMNRQYDTCAFREKINMLMDAFPQCGLGTDLIVGFPGETDALFDETETFVRSLPFTYFHVFPYSMRKGTPAAELPDQVPQKLKKIRAENLRELGNQKKVAFYKSWKDQKVTVLFESKDRGNRIGGFSSEYVRVEIPFDHALMNQILSVQITDVKNEYVLGKPLSHH